MKTRFLKNKPKNTLASNYALSLIAAIALLASTEALSNSEVSEVSGVIPDSLPKATAVDFQKIKYPKPGEMSISTTQFCGDGDVAHYANTRPNVSFVTNGDVKFVLGYWSSPSPVASNTTKFIPTNANWHTLGYSEGVHSDGASTKEFIDMSTGTKTKTMNLLYTAQGLFNTYKGYKLPSSKKPSKFGTYLGVLMCKDFEKNVTSGIKAAQLLELYGTNNAFNKVYTGVKENVLKGNLGQAAKYGVTLSKSMVNISNTGSGGNVSSHNFTKLASSIRKLKAPASPNIAGYKAALNGSTKTQAMAIKKQLQTIGSCKELAGTSATKYWWEHVPQGATCRALGRNYIKAVDELFGEEEGAAPLAAADFDNLKVQIASQLITAAIIEDSQQKVHNATATNRAMVSCHPASGRYVDKIMGSMVLDMNGNKKSFSMIHPEGNFAIGGDAPYASNSYTIFNMSGGGTSILHEAGEDPVFDTRLGTKALNLRFNVRGVGCSKNIYCSLDEFLEMKDRS